jgi:hypothetical protein
MATYPSVRSSLGFRFHPETLTKLTLPAASRFLQTNYREGYADEVDTW